MAVDKTAYSNKDIEIRKITARLDDLSKQRALDEETINTTFKVNECNDVKRLLAEDYQTEIDSLQAQLKLLKEEINNIVLER